MDCHNEKNELEYWRKLYILRLNNAKNEYISEDIAEIAGFNERFLQAIWNEQHFKKGMLTEEGETLEVISRGTWNVSAGPDFQNAVIKIDGIEKRGDIEIHINRGDWYRHGHDKDSRYDNVILHVIWQRDGSDKPVGIAEFVMQNYMEEGWQRILWDIEELDYSYERRVGQGGCASKWTSRGDAEIMELLASAGMARFSAKIGTMTRLIKENGEKKALTEALFDVMGYRNNRRQFKELYQILDKEALFSPDKTAMEKEAMIFGAANLLPDTTQMNVPAEMEEYVRNLWELWWQQGQHAKMSLKWDNSGARPYNRAWRRVAAAILFLEKTSFAPDKWLVKSISNCQNAKLLFSEWERLAACDSPLRGYMDFCHKIRPAADLIGKPRFLDLICNALLPFIAAKSEIEENREHLELTKEMFALLPASQNNRLLKEAAIRFFMPPSRMKQVVKRYSHQQGLLDIYKNFCLMLKNDCRKCPFNEPD